MFRSEPLRALFALALVATLAACSPAALVAPPAGVSGAQSTNRAVRSAAPVLMVRGVPFAGSPAAASLFARPSNAESASDAVEIVPDKAAPKAWATSVFVSDFGSSGNGAVYQYAQKKNGALLGKIADVTNPQGLDGDAKGDLWVASTGDSTIREYAPGKYAATTVLSDAGEYPVSVAVCPNGTVYGSNAYDISNLPGNIEIYAAGATSPTGVVPDSNIYSARFAACDAENVLWYTYFDYKFDPNVASYDGKKVKQYGSLGLIFPGGVRIGKNGTTLGISDQDAFSIELFTKSNPGGGPYLTIAGKLFSDPVSFSFIKTQKDVWVADDVKADAVRVTLKGKGPITVGSGKLQMPIDAYAFPEGNT